MTSKDQFAANRPIKVRGLGAPMPIAPIGLIIPIWLIRPIALLPLSSLSGSSGLLGLLGLISLMSPIGLIGRFAEGGKRHSKRHQTATQKAAFRIAEGGLLQRA